MSVAAWATALGSLELTVWAFPAPMGLLRSTWGDDGLLLVLGAGEARAAGAVAEPFVGVAGSTKGESAYGSESRPSLSGDLDPRVGVYDEGLSSLGILG